MQHDNTQHCLHDSSLYKVLEPGAQNMDPPSFPALPPLIPAPFFAPVMTSSPHNMTSSQHNMSSPHNMAISSSHNMAFSSHNPSSVYSYPTTAGTQELYPSTSGTQDSYPSTSGTQESYASTSGTQELYTSDECSCSDSSENSLQLDKELTKLKSEQERIQLKIDQLTECPDVRREEKRARDRERTAHYRSAFSEDERREYREKQRLFQQERRQKESPDERKRRLERSAERQRMKRQNYTDEQKIRMKEINRIRTRERRAKETQEQRELRKIKDRIRMREKRALIKQVNDLGPEIVAQSCVQVLGSEELRTGQPISLSGSFPSRLSSATLDLASHIASHLFNQVPRGNRAPGTLPTDYVLSQQHTSSSGHQIFPNIQSSSSSSHALQNTSDNEHPSRGTECTSDNDSTSDMEETKLFTATSSGAGSHDPISDNLLRNISLPNTLSQSSLEDTALRHASQTSLSLEDTALRHASPTAAVLRHASPTLPDSVKSSALYTVAKHFLSEEHQKYLLHKERQRILRQSRRQNESEEERAQRLEKAAQRQRAKRQSLTDAEREKTKELNRVRAQRRRSEETHEQRLERREREKMRRREQRKVKKQGNTPATFLSCNMPSERQHFDTSDLRFDSNHRLHL